MNPRCARIEGIIGAFRKHSTLLLGSTFLRLPAGADQAAVTHGNIDGEIGGLTISDPPTQAEVQALRDKCGELADDMRALSTLVHALRGALVAAGMVTDGLCAADSFISSPHTITYPQQLHEIIPDGTVTQPA